MTLKIGKFEVGGRLLAPLAGYTDIAFRELCKGYGAGLTVTEMVSVRGLVRDNANTEILTRISERESPSCVQLFGNDPDEFARAAEMLDCDMIDINMGCPMPKIVKNGDGSALLKTPRLAGKIVAAIRNAVDKPVTVKTRIGFADGERSAGALIQSVAEAGAAAVTVHGRTAAQRYGGSSDVDAVKTLAKTSRVPIIYNGDVTRDNITELENTFGAVAIGRGALACPGIFSDVRVDALNIAREHLRLLSKYFDERYTVNASRKFFVHYFKGVVGGRTVREGVNRAQTVKEVHDVLDKFARM